MNNCCGEGKRNILIYACSGGANVAEVSDLAARQLMAEGEGSMFCLAGLGAGIEGMIQAAKDADMNLVIDGCPMDCAKKIFDRAAITNYRQVKVTDLGIEKIKGVRATEDQVDGAVDRAREVLAKN